MLRTSRVILLILLSVSGSLGVVAPSFADIYAYRDVEGVLHFTNTPTHSGYRRVIREARGKLSDASPSGTRFDEIIQTAADRYSLDADLIRAIIKAESAFNSDAHSRKGAMGLMQLMPETARLHNVGNVYDPGDNIDGGARHLRLLLGRYGGDLELSLAAYNAGEKAIEKYGGIPPYSETRDYVRRVLGYYRSYRRDGLQSIHEQARR